MSPKWEKFETIRRPPSGVKEYWDVNEKLSHTPFIDSSSASYAPDVDQRGNLHLIGSLSSPIIAIIDLKNIFISKRISILSSKRGRYNSVHLMYTYVVSHRMHH